MTVVKIDAADVLGRAPKTGDRVVLRARRLRGSAVVAGRLVVPRSVEVPLDAGVAEVEVEPGVMLAEFRCGTSVDSRPVEVAVPDQVEPVTLRALMEQTFQYEPPVVSAVARDAARASKAADRAEAGANRVGSAQAVVDAVAAVTEQADRAGAASLSASESAAAAGQSASGAKASETAVAEARRVIDGYRQTVVSAADAAGRERVLAEAARVGAEAAQADAVAQAEAASGSATSSKSEADRAKAEADRAAQSATSADTSAVAASGSASTAKGEADRARQAADSASETVASGSPDATTTMKGKVKLAGDLAGTADAPTIPALANKADKAHSHTIAQVTGLDTALSGKAAASHTHTTAQVDGLDAVLLKKIDAAQATPLAMGGMVAQRTTAGTMQAADPTAAADVATKGYVDGLLVVGNTAATDGKLHLVYE